MRYFGCYEVTPDIVGYLAGIGGDKTLFCCVNTRHSCHLTNTSIFPMRNGYYHDIVFLDKLSYELSDGFLGKNICLKI
jgi:hypothetical protein